MTLVNELLEYYKKNTEDFNYDIEELDSWMGYLDGERVVPMEELDDYYQDIEPLEILRRAFFGYDEAYAKSEENAPFNPNRDYFYLNGYGNLVSTDKHDYSDYLGEDVINDIIANSPNLELSSGAQEIIDEYEENEEE